MKYVLSFQYPVVQAPAVVVVSTPVLGRYPVQLRCPNCNNVSILRSYMVYEKTLFGIIFQTGFLCEQWLIM